IVQESKWCHENEFVNFNTPSPMESKHRRFAVAPKIFESCRFSSGLDEKEKRKTYRCGQRTVRLAVVACSQNQSSRAGAAK
ncbi:hypothetical protein TNCV_2987991, partial [Trichonephila clavipes]